MIDSNASTLLCSYADERRRQGVTEYLVRWKGCTEEDDTWESRATLEECAILDTWEASKQASSYEVHGSAPVFLSHCACVGR